MFNPKINEPSQPSYFILTKVSETKTADTTKIKENIATKPNVAINNYVSNRTAKLTCYPNPTTNAVTIDYQLKEGGDTQISLINSAGQQIAVIKNRAYQTKGSYSVSAIINGKPGNYIIKLMHDTEIYTRSIIKH